MVWGNNEDNDSNYDVVSNLESKEEEKENLFEDQIDDEIHMTPKTTLNSKVVRAMKNLQASYNEDANMIV